MNEIVNIERLKQLLGIDVLRKDVDKLKLQVSNVNSQPAVDVENLRKQIIDLQKQLNQLNVEKNQLLTEKSQLRLENNKLATDKSQLSTDIERIKAENKKISEDNDKRQQQVNKLQKQLLDYNLLALYDQLDDDTKGQIDTYFPRNVDNKAMLFTALQENNIKNFYKLVRNKINYKINDPKLKTLLRAVFDFYASSGLITIIEPNVGDPLDSDEHTSKSSNQSSGSPIRELLLFGYRDGENKVIETALVNA
jgi:hypothetical protein